MAVQYGCSPKRQLSSFSMESCVMDHLDITILGVGIHAQGTTATVAALIITVLYLRLRFRK
jgi:hypothetical protein